VILFYLVEGITKRTLLGYWGGGIAFLIGLWSGLYLLFNSPKLLSKNRLHLVASLGNWLSRLNDTFFDLIGINPWMFIFLGYSLVLLGHEHGYYTYFLAFALVTEGVLLVRALLHVTTKKGRTTLFSKLEPLGFLVPFLYSALVTWFALAFFATLTYLLYRVNAVSFSVADNIELQPWKVVDLYAWHLADSIPLADIPNTTKWPEPIPYSDHMVGLLVLCFKLMVITPIFASFQGYWAHRQSEVAASKDTQEEVDGGFESDTAIEG
jgi:hypothetical protein